MDSRLYHDTILDPLLYPFWQQCEEEYGLTYVMEDNAPGHLGVSIPYRIKNRMRTFWWPPQSPDMNPLETVWNDMKRELGKVAHTFHTEAEIAAYATEQWNKVTKERLRALICTMPQRVKDLVAAKGGYTKW